MSEEKWHRLPADEIGLLIGKDANATVFQTTAWQQAYRG